MNGYSRHDDCGFNVCLAIYCQYADSSKEQQDRKAATEKERYIYPKNATLVDLGPDRSCIY